MMEKRCNTLICISVIYSFFIWIRIDTYAANEVFAFGILLLECIFVLMSTHKSDGPKDVSKYRPLVDPNLMYVFLVPICVVNELVPPGSKSDSTTNLDDVQLCLGVTAVVIAKYCYLLGKHKIHAVIVLAAASIYVFSFGHFSLILIYAVSAVLTWKSLDWIPKAAPKSFSFAEMSICIQLCLYLVGRVLKEVLKTQDKLHDELRLKWIGATAVTAILLATVIVRTTRAFLSMLAFVSVYFVFAAIYLTFLTLSFQENVIWWLWKFITGDCTVMMVILSWGLFFGITVIWTVGHAFQLSISERKSKLEYSHGKESGFDECANASQPCRERRSTLTTERSCAKDDYHGTQQFHSKDSRQSVSFGTRKVFHVFILLVYIPGLLIAPHVLFLASCIAFGAFVIVEAARVFQVPGLGRHLDDILRTFVDERDQGVLFLTHFYLLIGLSLPMWITQSSLSGVPSLIKLYSGVLSLGIGDTVACVAGRAFGKHRWKGTKKTMEGTLSSVVAQLCFIYIFIYSGHLPEYSHTNLIFGVVHVALFEAFTDQIDNLVLPLALYPFLCSS